MGLMLREAIDPPPQEEIYVQSSIVATSSYVVLPPVVPIMSLPEFPATTSPGAIIPTKLLIPDLEIDAQVEQIGINAKGAISSPSTYKTIGWYKHGPQPGEEGLAILDGHFNNGIGLKGVFYNLSKIEIGDEVFLSDKNQKTLRFVVTSTSTLPSTARLDDINAQRKNPYEIVLITCEGEWILSKRTYADRMLVFATLVE